MLKKCAIPVVLVLFVACGADDLLGPGAARGVEGVVLLVPRCSVVTVLFDTGIR